VGGLGLETAVVLASWNASVLCTVRTSAKGEDLVRAALPRLAGSVVGSVHYGLVDFNSFASVRAFAKGVLSNKRWSTLDGLVFNAGLAYLGSRVTEDGLESMVQVNHYAQFLLARLLQPVVEASARRPNANTTRLLFVSSTYYLFRGALDREIYAHASRPQGRQHTTDLFGSRMLHTYADTKLMNVLTANKFAELFAEQGLNATSNSCSPGFVKTAFLDERGDDVLASGFNVLLDYFGRTVGEGAARAIQVLTEPGLARITGHFFDDYIPLPLSNQVTKRNADWLWRNSNLVVGFAA